MNFLKKSKLNSLRKKVQKLHEQAAQQANTNPQAEITAQHELAKFYEQLLFDKDLPQAEVLALECYRAAAALGDIKSHYLCGQKLLEQAKFWDMWSQNPIYGASIHKKYSQGFYEEAFAYLHKAEAHDYPLAKRLLGLANIYGWGMPKNTDEGFKLVLDSIEAEKAWDRVTKILEELKLNTPEFFAALRNYKGKG